MLGLYDSGSGGLSILKEILKLSPDISYQYFADLDYLPLGEKSNEQIINRTTECCKFLFDNGCNIVILACNSASVTSIRYIQNIWLPQNYSDKQVLSITSPFIELMLEEYAHLKDKKGLILATPKTVYSAFYQHEFKQRGFKNLLAVECPGLADVIENSMHSPSEIGSVIDKIIQTNRINVGDVDYVLLACTHYCLISSIIQSRFQVATIIDPSASITSKLMDYLKRHPEYPIFKHEPNFWMTGKNTEKYRIQIQEILNIQNPKIEKAF